MNAQPAAGPRSGPEEYRLQGHWLLAKMGKTVLRPGGIELTRQILAAATITSSDRVVEFGPGVGRTAALLLQLNPQSYQGIDPNPEGAAALEEILAGHQNATRITADAAATGLPDSSVDLVIGEAMLTMQNNEAKAAIIAEAARILAPGGRYCIHELCFTPADVSAQVTTAVAKEISRTIKVGARPLPVAEWIDLLEKAGFTIAFTAAAPMTLLEPRRLLQDEGLRGFFRIVKNVARNRPARARILQMRRTFAAHRHNLGAIGIVACKR